MEGAIPRNSQRAAPLVARLQTKIARGLGGLQVLPPRQRKNPLHRSPPSPFFGSSSSSFSSPAPAEGPAFPEPRMVANALLAGAGLAGAARTKDANLGGMP